MPLLIDWNKARATVKAAGIPLPVSLSKKGELLRILKKTAGEKQLPIKADVGGPLAKAKEINVKLKREEKKENKPADIKEAAASLGWATGFQLSVMPSDAAFAKVAERTHLPSDSLKALYFVKAAAGAFPRRAPVSRPRGKIAPPRGAAGAPAGAPEAAVAAAVPTGAPEAAATSAPASSGYSKPEGMSPLAIMLGGAAVPWLAAPALRSISNSLRGYPGGGGLFGNRVPFEGAMGGVDPRTESELSSMAYRRMATNAQLASIASRFAAANRVMYPPTLPGM